jgi:kinesin family protein C2/C3
VSGLNTFVDDEKGLCIRFEGVFGSPILCGISIRKDFPASKLNCFYRPRFQILF